MKLSRCPLCDRPQVFYKPLPPEQLKPNKGFKYNSVMTQGPSTHPKVKRWCYGRCMGLMADLDILITETLDYVKPENKRKLRAWIGDYQADIERDFAKLVRGLARGRSS